MNRGALAGVVLVGAIAGAYALRRGADAVALPVDDTDESATGETVLDYVNPWGAIEAMSDSARVERATEDQNVKAFLTLIAWAEGTEREPDPYRVCYSYRHTIRDLSEHPAVVRPDGSREWAGERLSDAMCRGAGLNPGCVSTAAGRYQMIRATWLGAKRALRLPDFGPASQDAAAVYLIESRRALEAVRDGRIVEAIRLCRQEWASLPGNSAGQPQRRTDELLAQFERAGGNLA